MLIERNDIFQLAGKDVTIVGSDVNVGQAAPDFKVHALDWSDVHGLADTAGKQPRVRR